MPEYTFIIGVRDGTFTTYGKFIVVVADANELPVFTEGSKVCELGREWGDRING